MKIEMTHKAYNREEIIKRTNPVRAALRCAEMYQEIKPQLIQAEQELASTPVQDNPAALEKRAECLRVRNRLKASLEAAASGTGDLPALRGAADFADFSALVAWELSLWLSKIFPMLHEGAGRNSELCKNMLSLIDETVIDAAHNLKAKVEQEYRRA